MSRTDVRWQVGLDDLTGKWCAFIDSEAPTLADGSRVVADFADEETAEHVVAVHNATIR